MFTYSLKYRVIWNVDYQIHEANVLFNQEGDLHYIRKLRANQSINREAEPMGFNNPESKTFLIYFYNQIKMFLMEINQI